MCKRNRCTTKVLLVLKFLEVGDQNFFSKSQQIGRFLIFQSKLLFFVAGRCSFWVKVWNLFYKISVGRTFFFFHAKLLFFWAGRCSFWVKKRQFIEIFLRKTEIKEKAFPWLATSQNLPRVQARRRFFSMLGKWQSA